jgi:2-keto-4-pentenoate hydratase/2-oxohepta-3-ene-1,7-dioic acid hydratase in catechol pathway
LNQVYLSNELVAPTKVVCVGRNYIEHIKELKNEVPSSMVVFNKSNNAITNELYFFHEDFHFEVEISFMIYEGNICGVGIGIDLTNRKLQSFLKEKGLPWERAKSFDKSAVFSKFVPFSYNENSNLNFKFYLNGNLQQEANEELMIYKPLDIVDEVLSFMSFEDGDIIMSGTPKGVNSYKKGDTFKVELFNNEELLVKEEWMAK